MQLYKAPGEYEISLYIHCNRYWGQSVWGGPLGEDEGLILILDKISHEAFHEKTCFDVLGGTNLFFKAHTMGSVNRFRYSNSGFGEHS